MPVFTKVFFIHALEAALVTGGTTFAGALTITGTPSLHGLIAAATSAGLAALYCFIKQYSVVQVTNTPNTTDPKGAHSINAQGLM